jgi:hypothetical protein
MNDERQKNFYDRQKYRWYIESPPKKRYDSLVIAVCLLIASVLTAFLWFWYGG